ncbi:hypothetical protein C8T65DRAFT_267979 [Cerioporus squamosus]|nr:hypothetical protein C8T65DRAFT_267979 [Cerioporus squamosus]
MAGMRRTCGHGAGRRRRARRREGLSWRSTARRSRRRRAARASLGRSRFCLRRRRWTASPCPPGRRKWSCSGAGGAHEGERPDIVQLVWQEVARRESHFSRVCLLACAHFTGCRRVRATRSLSTSSTSICAFSRACANMFVIPVFTVADAAGDTHVVVDDEPPPRVHVVEGAAQVHARALPCRRAWPGPGAGGVGARRGDGEEEVEDVRRVAPAGVPDVSPVGVPQ